MKKIKVALIDDDKEFLEELKDVLAMSGYDTVAVNNPEQAVSMIDAAKPDVILMDLKMPNKTGLELAGEINRHLAEAPVPIIAMSAYFKDDFISLLNFCGIKKFLRKPFNPLDAISEIENVTKGPALKPK